MNNFIKTDTTGTRKRNNHHTDLNLKVDDVVTRWSFKRFTSRKPNSYHLTIYFEKQNIG